MSPSLFGILTPRSITLFVFILIVLFLGATFNVQVGPESFVEGAEADSKADSKKSEKAATTLNPVIQSAGNSVPSIQSEIQSAMSSVGSMSGLSNPLPTSR